MARSCAAWAMRARKKRPKISVPCCLSRSFAVLMRITLPALISVNRSSFDVGLDEHPIEGAVLADGKQPGDDLLLGLREDRGIELRFEKLSRAPFQAFARYGANFLRPFGSISSRNVWMVAFGMSCMACRAIAEQRRLPARHLRAEQALQDELHDLGSGIQQALAVEEGIRMQSLQPDIEEVERNGVFHIGRIDQDELAVEQVAFGKDRQAGHHRDQRVLGIDDDDRRLAIGDALQIIA